MPVSIRSFIPQLRSARLYDIQTTNIANEIARLSTGERMLRANDNAAGIALSENLRTQVISYNQAIRNCQDATSMLRTAEGGLDETGKILHRMRELVVRGASDNNTESDRAKIFKELEALSGDIEIICKCSPCCSLAGRGRRRLRLSGAL